MSYQFEDDSALEELLNQQLDRRKHQQSSSSAKQTRNATRPATGGPSQSLGPGQAPNFRPSTAASSSGVGGSAQGTTTKPSEALEGDDSGSQFASASLPSAGRTTLSSWLQGGASKQHQQQPERVGGSGKMPTAVKLAPTGGEFRPARKVSLTNQPIGDHQDDRANILLEDLLSPANLQDMSKQRLIQVILEDVKPRLSQAEGSIGQDLAREREKLERALQFERNRLEAIEMRHGEMLEFERQKWLQINQQLESRLQSDELQLNKLLEDQRNHLAQLNEHYQKQLESLNGTLNERLRFERTRFDEMLKERDAMHKLELEAKLGVDCNLDKLNAVQLDWRRTLEATIQQLGDQYKAIEAQLQRQALMCNSSNSELASKSKLLCDQFDNYHNNQLELTRLAEKLNELISGLAQVEQRAGKALEGSDDKLAKLNAQLETLAEGERRNVSSRLELDELRNRLQEDKFKLALDASRLSMKEERLDELLARNSKIELELTGERKSLMEAQTQAHSRRLTLDERFAELKDQNYAMHLLRKRLVAEREELVKAQLELAEERKTFKRSRLQVEDEGKRLETLKVRVQRELDQLRRLQKSLVCSLCLSRLFGETDTESGLGQLGQISSKQQCLTEDISNWPTIDRLGTKVDDQAGGRQRRPRVQEQVKDNGDELAAQLRRTQLNASEIAAEHKHIEELVGTELL